MATKFTGGCQCGNIRYGVVGTPKQLVVCHALIASGSPAARLGRDSPDGFFRLGVHSAASRSALANCAWIAGSQPISRIAGRKNPCAVGPA